MRKTLAPSRAKYQAGYRAGVIAADKDVQNFDKPGSPGVDANNITCPPDSSPDYCSGAFTRLEMKDKVILSMVLLVLIATSTTVIAIPALAKKSPEYKQGFKDGQAAETADEQTTIGIPKNNHQCNRTFDYCNGFADGYQHQIEVSFRELNLD